MLVFAFAAASLARCPVEHAHYSLRNNPGIAAYFRQVNSGSNWPSGLALAIHHKSSGKTFWWLPWVGGTDGLQNMASTEDVTKKGWRPPSPDDGPRPYGDRQYLGTDAGYNIISDWLRRGTIAPAHMLFPNSASARDTVFPTKQFFDLVSCAAS
jgi:hypothetical protein